ncbi:MAG: RNA-dependent RNA polymerase [Hangzhou chuvirus 1]|nr:MAG: RNA-dependent RNA polymerase [Hangzhou chuvirus 1]
MFRRRANIEEEFGQTRTGKFNFYDLVTERKLSRALRDSQVKRFERLLDEEDPQWTADDHLLLSHLDSSKDLYFDPTAYVKLLDKTLTNDLSRNTTTDTLVSIYPIIESLINHQVTYMQKNNVLRPAYITIMNKLTTWTQNWSKNLKANDYIYKLLTVGKELNKLVSKMAQVQDIKLRNNDYDEYIKRMNLVNKFTIEILNITLVWNHQLVLITYHDDECQFIAPIDFGLLACNKIHDLTSIILLTQFGQDVQFPANAMTILMRFIKEGINLAYKYKSDFYTIMKSLEGIINAEILVDVEDWENVEFLMNIHFDLKKEVKFNYLGSRLRRIIQQAPTNYKYELGCLSKIFGHPYVDMTEGSASMFKKAQQYYKIDMDMVLKSTCYIKENFVKNYYARHKVWPPVELRYGCSKLISYANLLNLPVNSPSIPLSYREGHNIDSWHFVELKPCEDFVNIENAIPYLKDRTISLLRGQVEEKYLSEEETTEWIDWKKTRLLLAFLISPQIMLNHQKYISRYAKSTTLDDLIDYLVIRIVPKEKELKVKFRGFGCKTYEDRMRCLAQEKTATQYLEKYSEDQAMAIDEISLQKKLRTFRNMKIAYEQHKLLYVNIDASSWCTHMRRETIDVPLKETLDKIYNTSIFGKTQLSYQKTLIYVPDSEYTEFWVGQEAGVEGLNQESWVTVYIAQIKAALEGLTYKYYILCRGDDLRVIFCIPNSDLANESLLEIKSRILVALNTRMWKVGHEIKIQDSYGSEKYFTFCKQASVCNIELSQSYRKIQKCYGANNAFLETLDEYIASSFSNGHSAAKASPTPLPSYAVSVFWSLYDLKMSPYYKNLTNAHYTALMLIPSLAGGFPIIYLHNFFVRAESDLLTPFIDLYTHISNRDYATAKVMSNFMYVDYKIPKTYEALYNDPYTLPTCRPVLPTGYLRAQMSDALEKITKNEMILELIREVKSTRQQNIIKLLDTCNILHAKPLSVIYQATPKAILGSILKMFENSRSVLQLLCNNRRKQMVFYIKKAYQHETQLQAWRVKNLYGTNKGRSYVHLIDANCPLKSADDIREFAWGKKVVGVTMPTMSHLYTIINKEDAPISEFIDNNHFTYSMEEPSLKLGNEDSDNFVSGTQVPFVGFKTRPGTQMPQIHFVEHNQFLNHMKNMTELNSWFSSQRIENGEIITSNISKLIMKIVSLYTQEDPESIIPYVGFRRSGVIEHHLACQGFLSAIVPNTLSNRYTIVKGKTDTHKTLVMQHDKYKLNLLHIFCSVVTNLTFELDVSNKLKHKDRDIYVITTDCPYCTAKIEEYPLRFNEEGINALYLKPLKALRISKEAISIFDKTRNKYDQQVFHNLAKTRELSMEVAAMGILMEDFNAFRSSINTVVADIGGHVPNVESYDILKNMHIHRSTKNTSITELKAIPAEVLTTALSQLITDYVLGSNKRIYTSDQLSGLCTKPGHMYPWYKILESLAHTGVINQVFTILQNRTRLKMYNMSVSISDLAIKIVPLAVSYSLYHDTTPSKFIIVHDLVPEVNNRSFTNSIARTVMRKVYDESIAYLDPASSMRRSIQPDIDRLFAFEFFDLLPQRSKTRIMATIRGIMILFSGYLRRDQFFRMPQETLNDSMTLGELFQKHVMRDEADEALDDTNDDEDNELYHTAEGFRLDVIIEEASQYQYEIEQNTGTAFQSERLEYIMNCLSKQSGGRLYSYLTQLCITEATFLRLLIHLRNDPDFDFDNLIEIGRNDTANLLIEIVSTPIVSCGQRLRREIRAMGHRERVQRGVLQPMEISVAYPPTGKFCYTTRCHFVEDINQPYNNKDTFPMRDIPHNYVNPKFIMALRPFGILTSSYSIFMEIVIAFKIPQRKLKIFAAGVGYGGDLIFIQNYFQGSQVYIQTLLSGNYNRDALDVHFDTTKDPLEIIDEHLTLGYESAFEERTLRKAIQDFGRNIDLFWIDIEYSDEIDDTILMPNMYMLLQYALHTKSLGACLIIKVTLRCTKTVLMIISLLTQLKLSVYPTRPQSQLPCDYIYLVTVGICNARDFFDPVIGNRTFPMWTVHYNNVLTVVKHSHKVLNEYQDRESYKLPTSAKTSVLYDHVTNQAPILWMSCLTSKLNYTIHEDAIEKMLRNLRTGQDYRLTKNDLIKRAYSNFVFKYEELHNRHLENLYNPDRGSSLDNQAIRISTIKQCCLMTGFHHIHTFLQTFGNEKELTSDMFLRGFYEYIQTFHRRDTHINPEEPDYKIVERNYKINGVSANYAESYIEGANIGICMMGWVNYMYDRLRR